MLTAPTDHWTQPDDWPDPEDTVGYGQPPVLPPDEPSDEEKSIFHELQ